MAELVSVIVTIHNLERYLPRLLTALRFQSYDQLEVLLVDDASTDGSLGMIQQAARKDARLRVLERSTCGGVSAARNTGLAVARGDYVIFVDGDDWMVRDYVRHFVEGAQASNADVVVNPFVIQKRGHDTIIGRWQLPHTMTREQFIASVIAPAGSVRGYLWNKMFRRRLIAENNLWFDDDLDTMEDELFTVRYAIHAQRFYFGAHPDYRYGVHAGSLTTSNDALSLLGQQTAAFRTINHVISSARIQQRGKRPTDQALEKG